MACAQVKPLSGSRMAICYRRVTIRKADMSVTGNGTTSRVTYFVRRTILSNSYLFAFSSSLLYHSRYFCVWRMPESTSFCFFESEMLKSVELIPNESI